MTGAQPCQQQPEEEKPQTQELFWGRKRALTLPQRSAQRPPAAPSRMAPESRAEQGCRDREGLRLPWLQPHAGAGVQGLQIQLLPGPAARQCQAQARGLSWFLLPQDPALGWQQERGTVRICPYVPGLLGAGAAAHPPSPSMPKAKPRCETHRPSSPPALLPTPRPGPTSLPTPPGRAHRCPPPSAPSWRAAPPAPSLPAALSRCCCFGVRTPARPGASWGDSGPVRGQ